MEVASLGFYLGIPLLGKTPHQRVSSLFLIKFLISLLGGSRSNYL